VLDVRLPGLSGLDLQEELAAKKVSLPIVFITGRGDIPMSVRAMKAAQLSSLPSPSANKTSWKRSSVGSNKIESRDKIAPKDADCNSDMPR
jgi:FixJ family two-component response regulator